MSVAASAVVAPGVELVEVEIEDFVRIGHGGSGPPPQIGPGSVIRAGTVVYAGVVAGRGLQTGHHAVIRSGAEIGDNVVVGTLAILDGECRIGDRVSIQSGVYIPPGTTVGADAFLGPYCVFTNDRAMGSYARSIMASGERLIGPTIERAARIGAQATVLPGVTVGAEAVVGAGAVVTRDVAPGAIVVGNPARWVADAPTDQLHPTSREEA